MDCEKWALQQNGAKSWKGERLKKKERRFIASFIAFNFNERL